MSATPMVLLHAFPLEASMWHDVRQRLSPAIPVLAPDLPGLGQAALPDGDPDLHRSAELVVAALDAAGYQRAVLAGVSMGGYVALAFAQAYPERLAGLGLIDTKAGADDDAARENRLRVAREVMGPSGSEVLSPMVEVLLGQTTKDTRPEIVQDVRTRIRQARAEGVAWSQRAMAARPDRLDLLRGLQVPAIVVVGEQDTVTPPDQAQLMADTLPDAVLTVVPDVGHLTPLEAPEAVANALMGLMVRVSD